MSVFITKGDVLESKVDGTKVIVHCCNDINWFGSGVAGNISRKWPDVKNYYHSWHNREVTTDTPFVLGQIQFVKAEDNVWVCNLIGQRGIGGFTIDGVFIPPVRYEALTEGFLRLREKIKKSGNKKVSIHAPLLCTGLAGGNLDRVYLTAHNIFKDIDFTFYAFSDEDWKNLQSIHEAVNMKREDIDKLPKGRQNIIEYIESGRTDKM